MYLDLTEVHCGIRSYRVPIRVHGKGVLGKFCATSAFEVFARIAIFGSTKNVDERGCLSYTAIQRTKSFIII